MDARDLVFDPTVNLLLGEALYGDPSLCIRELLQNALDAVELRDLRLQFKQKQAGAPLTPGTFRDELGAPQELAVNLTWGHDEAKGWWIQVSDNGVGMTGDAVERYFTRLGKSFYRSPAFNVEQQEMKRAGLLCTPISQFGIGILSCFMIADRIEVRTNAGPGNDPLDFNVSGPGSLFWANKGSREKQGTDVKLWLKNHTLGHNWDQCLAALRKHFGYSEPRKGAPEIDYLDPCEIAARHVVWPKYPVHVDIPGGPRRTIDHLFHVRVLAPLNVEKLLAKANEWDIPLDKAPTPAWGIHDWTDAETGNRIRLWFPQFGLPNGSACQLSDVDGPIPSWQLLTLTEPQLERPAEGRQRLLVQSMFVGRVEVLRETLALKAAPGCRIWADFRGDACPRLKADRSEALIPKNRPEWPAAIDAVWESFFLHLRGCTGDSKAAAAVLLFEMTQERRKQIAGPGESPAGFSLPGVGMDGASQFWSASLERDRDLAHNRARSRALGWHGSGPHGAELLASHFLQEGLWPSLRESWPPLGVFGRDGYIGEAHLTAPACCEFREQPPNRLDQLGYDVCFPLTVVPLGMLRRGAPAWISDRTLHQSAVLPFLIPANGGAWRERATIFRQEIGLDTLYAFLPAHDLWWKPFADWTPEDERHTDNLSLFWSIVTGDVLAYPGLLPRDQMNLKTPGVQPFDQYAEEYVKRRQQ